MIKAYNDRVVFKKVDLEERTKGGIILAEMEKERETCFGEVIEVGPGKLVEGSERFPMETKKGDIIVCNERVPMRTMLKGEYLYVIREADIYYSIQDDEIKVKSFVTEGGDEYDMHPTIRI